MASSTLTVSLSVRFPWWWRPYLWALQFFAGMGVLLVDVDAAAAFIARHTRIVCHDGSKEVDVRTKRYFERAPLGHHVCPSDLDLDEE